MHCNLFLQWWTHKNLEFGAILDGFSWISLGQSVANGSNDCSSHELIEIFDSIPKTFIGTCCKLEFCLKHVKTALKQRIKRFLPI